MESSKIYQQRNNEQIREWWKQFGKNEMMTSQDRAKEHAVVDNGMVRVFTYSNRATYIGQLGVHGTPEGFKRGKYDIMHGDRISGDDTIESFVDITQAQIDKYLSNIREHGFR